MAPMFKNAVKMPDEKANSTLARYVKYFNDVERFDELKERVTMATKTPLSIFELNKLIGAASKSEVVLPGLSSRLEEITGVRQSYSIGNLDEIPARKAQMLPTNITVYDGMNIATELATHFQPADPRRLHAFVGDMLASETNLQEVIDFSVVRPDHVFRDFFFTQN
jgi:hypothetical protein